MNPYKFKSGFNVKLFILISSAFLLILYGIFNARNLIMGPSLKMFNPTTDMETGENIILVKGQVENMTFLSLNERPIFVDTDGIFEEKLLLSPGSNIIEIRVRDRFKKEIFKRIRVYYRETPPTLEEFSASSTEEVVPEN